MITFEQAYDTISDRLGDIEITRILDAGYFWLFEAPLYTPGTKEIVPGWPSYAVNKSDGKIWYLPIPPRWTDEQRAAMENAKEIPVPDR